MFNKSNAITYLGSKRRLLGQLNDCISQKLSSGAKVLDLFSGSGVVSAFLRDQGYMVHANDIAPYSDVINFVNLELFPELVKESYPDLESYFDHLNSLTVPRSHFYFSRYYSENSEATRERLFYTRSNGLFVDAVLEEIWELDDEALRRIVLHNVLLKMSKHVNTCGVFKGFYKTFGGSKSDALSRIRAKIEIDIPQFLTGPIGKSYKYDACKFFDEVEETYDLIYLDPPYNQHQYSANYHLLEYACLPFHDRYIPTDDQVSGIDPALYKSPYCSKRKCFAEMDSLISLCSRRSTTSVISYSENGHIDKASMKNLLLKYGAVDVHDIDYVNFRGGRNRKKSKNKVSEFLFSVKI